MKLTRSRRVAATAVRAAVLLLMVFMRVAGQSGAKNGDWRTYGADLGNTHYSLLDQISGNNFNVGTGRQQRVARSGIPGW